MSKEFIFGTESLMEPFRERLVENGGLRAECKKRIGELYEDLRERVREKKLMGISGFLLPEEATSMGTKTVATTLLSELLTGNYISRLHLQPKPIGSIGEKSTSSTEARLPRPLSVLQMRIST